MKSRAEVVREMLGRQREAAANQRNHTGVSARCRADLAQHGTSTAAEVAARIGVPVDVVAPCLSQLARYGGVVSDGKRPGTRYTLYVSRAAKQKAKSSGKPAGRITIPQQRWGASRLG